MEDGVSELSCVFPGGFVPLLLITSMCQRCSPGVIAGGERPDFSLHGEAAADHGADGVLPGGHQGERPQRLPAGQGSAPRSSGKALRSQSPGVQHSQRRCSEGGVSGFASPKSKGQTLIVEP